VVWQREIDDYNSVTEAVARPAGGRFGPPKAISSPVWNSHDAHVAMDRKGNSVVVYRKSNDSAVYNLYAVSRPAGGKFTSPVKVSDDTGIRGTFVTSTGVGMDDYGTTVAIWAQNDDNRVHYAVRPAGGSFGAPQPIANPGGYTFRPDYAVSRNGDAVAVWGDYGGLVYAAVRKRGGNFTEGKLLNAENDAVVNPHVAMDAKGNAIAVWIECEGDCSKNAWVEYAYRSTGGSFGPRRRVARVFYMGAYEPVVAMAPGGRAAIAWVGDSLTPRLYANATAVIRPAHGGFGPPEPVMTAGTPKHPVGSPFDRPRAAFDGQGTLYVGLRRYIADDGAGHLKAQALAAVRHPRSRFNGSFTVLSRSDLNIWPVTVAAAGSGKALVAWPIGTFQRNFWIQAANYAVKAGRR
jgi:hypothetical protein